MALTGHWGKEVLGVVSFGTIQYSTELYRKRLPRSRHAERRTTPNKQLPMWRWRVPRRHWLGPPIVRPHATCLRIGTSRKRTEDVCLGPVPKTRSQGERARGPSFFCRLDSLDPTARVDVPSHKVTHERITVERHIKLSKYFFLIFNSYLFFRNSGSYIYYTTDCRRV